jgi:hypothetical protein
MTWRRLFDVILHRPPPPDAERSTKGGQLAALELEVQTSVKVAADLRSGAHDRRLDAYSRVRLPR